MEEEQENASDFISGFLFRTSNIQSQIIQLVEEVRYRRNLDQQNVDRIKRLIEEKELLEREREEEQTKFDDDREKDKARLREVSQAYENKISALREETAKCKTASETAKLVAKALKDEIKSLMLSNLEGQNRVSDLDSQLRLESNLRRTCFDQVQICRQERDKAHLASKKLAKMQDVIKKMVSQAITEQQKLRYCYNHRIKDAQKQAEESENLRVELIRLRSSIVEQQMKKPLTEADLEVVKLNTRIKRYTEEKTALEKEVDEAKKENLRNVSALARTSHLLLQSQLRKNALEVEVNNLTSELKRVRSSLEGAEARAAEAQQQHLFLLTQYQEKEAQRTASHDKETQCPSPLEEVPEERPTGPEEDIGNQPIDVEVCGDNAEEELCGNQAEGEVCANLPQGNEVSGIQTEEGVRGSQAEESVCGNGIGPLPGSAHTAVAGDEDEAVPPTQQGAGQSEIKVTTFTTDTEVRDQQVSSNETRPSQGGDTSKTVSQGMAAPDRNVSTKINTETKFGYNLELLFDDGLWLGTRKAN